MTATNSSTNARTDGTAHPAHPAPRAWSGNHAVCSDLAHGFTYIQEEETIATQAPGLGPDKAILFVEDAHAFYCPTQ